MIDFGSRVKERREALSMSQEELAQLLDYSDKSSISKIENNQRDITRGKVIEFAKVLKTTPSYLMGWTDDPTDLTRFGALPVTRHKIPVIGKVHCGEPVYAEEDFLDVVDSEIQADFALRTEGDSMTGAGITEGDLVFVRKQSDVDNGDLAVVLIGDEAAVKRVYKYDTYLSLNAENPAYAPILLHDGDGKDISVLGKVVAHLHYIKERKSRE